LGQQHGARSGFPRSVLLAEGLARSHRGRTCSVDARCRRRRQPGRSPKTGGASCAPWPPFLAEGGDGLAAEARSNSAGQSPARKSCGRCRLVDPVPEVTRSTDRPRCDFHPGPTPSTTATWCGPAPEIHLINCSAPLGCIWDGLLPQKNNGFFDAHRFPSPWSSPARSRNGKDAGIAVADSSPGGGVGWWTPNSITLGAQKTAPDVEAAVDDHLGFRWDPGAGRLGRRRNIAALAMSRRLPDQPGGALGPDRSCPAIFLDPPSAASAPRVPMGRLAASGVGRMKPGQSLFHAGTFVCSAPSSVATVRVHVDDGRLRHVVEWGP